MINSRQETEYSSRLWKRLALLWGPPSLLLFKRRRGFDRQGKIGKGVKKIIYLHLVPRLGMSEAKLLLGIRLHSRHWNDFTFFMFTAFMNIDVAWRDKGKLTNCTNSLLPVCLRGNLGLNSRPLMTNWWCWASGIETGILRALLFFPLNCHSKKFPYSLFCHPAGRKLVN